MEWYFATNTWSHQQSIRDDLREYCSAISVVAQIKIMAEIVSIKSWHLNSNGGMHCHRLLDYFHSSERIMVFEEDASIKKGVLCSLLVIVRCSHIYIILLRIPHKLENNGQEKLCASWSWLLMGVDRDIIDYIIYKNECMHK